SMIACLSVLPTTVVSFFCFFFFSSRRRHTRSLRDWSSDVCSSDLAKSFRQVSAMMSSFTSGFPMRETWRNDLAPWRSSAGGFFRSEERRVGKEGRSGWAGGEYEHKGRGRRVEACRVERTASGESDE